MNMSNLDTVVYIKSIRDSFDNINMKGTGYRKCKRGEERNPIKRESTNEYLLNIENFGFYLIRWETERPPRKSLSRETFQNAIRTCALFPSLVRYLHERYFYLK